MQEKNVKLGKIIIDIIGHRDYKSYNVVSICDISKVWSAE